MKDKTKRKWLIVLGALVCVALVVVIASRFGTAATTDDPALSSDTESTSDPTVDIDDTGNSDIVVKIDSDDAVDDNTTSGAGADSEGTEQTIQADPVKPDEPENLTAAEDDHDGEDVPEDERNTETPPAYDEGQTTVTSESTEPQGGSTNASGQIYVPGFGYVDGSGEGTAVQDESIYENGNKVGVMD